MYKMNKKIVLLMFMMFICSSNVYAEPTPQDSEYQSDKIAEIELKVNEIEKQAYGLEPNNDVTYMKKEIETLKQDIKDIKKDRIDEYKEVRDRIDMVDEKKINISSIITIMAVLGVGLVGSMCQLYRNMNKFVKERLDFLLEEKSETLEKMVYSHEYEERKKKDTNLLVISNNDEGKHKIKNYLSKMFVPQNIEFITWDVLTANNKMYLDEEFTVEYIEEVRKKDIVFFDNNGDSKDCEVDSKMKIEATIIQLDSVINKNGGKMCFFYYNTNRIVLDSNVINKNFANSEATIYSNLMDLLKYKDRIIGKK